MNKSKAKRLKAMGGRVVTVTEFLNLSPEEEKLVETGLALTTLVRSVRERRGLSQSELAAMLGTKQPNIARLEQATASFDLLFKALYAMGVKPSEIAHAIEGVEEKELMAA